MSRPTSPKAAIDAAPLALLVMPPVLGLAVLAAVGALAASVPGLPDPGTLTRVGLPVARGLRDGATALTVGLLVLAAVAVPPTTRQTSESVEGLRLRATRWGASCARLAAAASVTVIALTYSELAGTAPFAPGWPGQVVYYVTDFDQGRAMAVSAGALLLAGTLASLATRVNTLGWAALAAVAALLPLALTGHAAGGSNHALAVDAQAGHLIGVSVWAGGLGALLLLGRHLTQAGLSAVAGRFSTVAGWAYALTVTSGVAAAVARLDTWSALLSTYGTLLGVKVVLLTVLGIAGYVHRRRLLPRLATGTADTSRRGFVRLASAEVLLLATAMGLGTALSATSPPTNGSSESSTAQALLGYPMPPPMMAGLHWLTQWRIDTVWVPVAVVAVGWYLLAVRRLRARGDRWGPGRTIAWVLGWAVMVAATSGSPGVYGKVLFSAHMVQHMTIALAVPTLLVFGAPVTLALRTIPGRRDGSRGPREWLLAVVSSRVLGALGHPVVAAGLFIAALNVFYYTPLLELSMRTNTGHVLMTTHFLLSGYLLASAIVGVDPGPSRPPHVYRMVLLMATFGFHALFSVALMSSTQILGEEWFSALGRDWGNTLAREQYLGGAIGWALGDYPVAMMAIALALDWIRSDEREQRRYDRQANRDNDAALAAYNAHLGRLAARNTPATTATGPITGERRDLEGTGHG